MKINKVFILLVAVLLGSCAEDFVETTPTLELPGETAITDVTSAESALIGMYSSMQFIGVYGGDDVFITSLYADELVHTGSFPSFAEMGSNDPALNNVEITGYWTDHYSAIYRANYIIEAVQDPTNEIPEVDQDRIIGQALATRALLYYKLVKVYGGVPLVVNAYTSSEAIDQNPVSRSSVSETYTQIQNDVTEAINRLPDGLGIYFFNRDAARVLKAKVEMELGQYSAAKATLAPVLGNYSLETSYSNLFPAGGLTASSSETIFAIDFNETDGSNHAFFLLGSSFGGRGEVGPSGQLLAEFEDGDARLSEITADPFVFKYKNPGAGDDDAYVFRYADVLLMQAEILAREDDPAASDFLNEVRSRAGLGPVVINSSNVVDVIAHERFVEFYGESSDRLFTITRLGIADDVISAKANNTFVAERNNLWPIPQQEIERNSAIGVENQNPGY